MWRMIGLIWVLAWSAAPLARAEVAVPDDAAGFIVFCADAPHFSACRSAVLAVNAYNYRDVANGYPNCAFRDHDKSSIDRKVEALLQWMTAHPAPDGASRDWLIDNALHRTIWC
jgi:hypothetical protein